SQSKPEILGWSQFLAGTRLPGGEHLDGDPCTSEQGAQRPEIEREAKAVPWRIERHLLERSRNRREAQVFGSGTRGPGRCALLLRRANREQSVQRQRKMADKRLTPRVAVGEIERQVALVDCELLVRRVAARRKRHRYEEPIIAKAAGSVGRRTLLDRLGPERVQVEDLRNAELQRARQSEIAHELGAGAAAPSLQADGGNVDT